MGGARGALEQRAGERCSSGAAGAPRGRRPRGADRVRQHFQLVVGASDDAASGVCHADGTGRGAGAAGATDVGRGSVAGAARRSGELAAGALGAHGHRALRAEGHPPAIECGVERGGAGFHPGCIHGVRNAVRIDPGLAVVRVDISDLLRISASSSREAGRARNALLIAEVALSMTLLAGAGLLVRSFVTLSSLSPGFDAKGVLTLDISVPDAHYKNSLALQSYWDEVLATVRSLPGVASVGAVTPLPLSGDDFSSSFRVEGRSVPEKDEPSAEVRWATPDYFRSMAIPLRQGRLFTDADRLGAARVLLISEGAARTFFPADDAMGRKIAFGARGGYEKNEGEIVGIVGDVRHYGLDAPVAPMFYVPLAQAGMDGATVVIRAQGLPTALGQPARKLLQGIDRDALVGEPVLLETLVAGSLGQRRFYLMLLGAFAASALVLAMVGLYGVISYSVAQRTREIGIRIALGATRRQVLSMVMRRGLLLVGLGLAAGQMMALMLNRTLKGLLVGVSTTDPLTLTVTGALLLFAAVLACYVPARRATRADPLVALRYE